MWDELERAILGSELVRGGEVKGLERTPLELGQPWKVKGGTGDTVGDLVTATCAVGGTPGARGLRSARPSGPCAAPGADIILNVNPN